MDVPLELITSFITITALETILAIDNLLFIYLITSKLPKNQQRKAQIIAISLAAVMRIACLLLISVIMQMTLPLFYIAGNGISMKDMILIMGGLFLIFKAAHEVLLIYRPKSATQKIYHNIGIAVLQIVLIDAVFSIDSVITAIGLTENTWVIIASIISACILMLIASKYLIKLTNSLQLKLIALVSLIFIGGILAAAGIDIKIDKTYLLVAIAFAMIIYTLHKTITKHNARKS
ncbi:TerC family protein [Facilibium subflavum]|uniref:TerC family protein n=1 Tax=Facilibium subflavum TaxID=2219058 RepID=UPI000E64B34C|nr:TerC family protein [Facilibium subflavum]